MRAVVYDPDAPTNLSFGDVAEPVPAADEVLTEVKAIALNFGEIHWIESARQPGEVPGWDSAGVVVQAAADGSGPPEGTRVVAFNGAGGWAQRRVASTRNVAVLPDSVEFSDAAALPVAGVTALQALRALGPVVGRRVLITGRIRWGRPIRRPVGGPRRRTCHRGRRKRRAWCGSAGAGRRRGGGRLGRDHRTGVRCARQRRRAFTRAGLQPHWRGGSAQSIGMASGQPTTIDFEAERHFSVRKRLEPFTVQEPFAPDLDYLLELLTNGELDTQIGLRDPGITSPPPQRRC